MIRNIFLRSDCTKSFWLLQLNNTFSTNWTGKSRVVDTNTMNLDPDPGFCPNLDPDPDPWLCYQLWNKKIKNNFRKKLSLLKYIFLQQMSHKVSWATELLIYILHLLSPFYPFFLHEWIRIRILNRYGSGSTKLLNTDSIRIRFRIRIHNTGKAGAAPPQHR